MPDQPISAGSRWTEDVLRPWLLKTDDVPEQMVARMLAEESKLDAKKLFSMLVSSIDLPLSEFPDYAQDHFAETGKIPDWVDPEAVLRGQRIFADHGPLMLITLFYKALPTLYLTKSGAPVLEMTGRLTNQSGDQQIFSRRIAESGQFLIDVMTSGSLVEGGKGIQTTQRVRIIHAIIRNFLPKERYEDVYGVKPINQLHMALTLMTFSMSMLDGVKKYGIKFTDQEEKDYLHAWRLIGHIQGIDASLLPDTPQEGRDLLEMILKMEQGPSEAGKKLTQAVIHFAEEALKGKAFDASPVVMIRYLMGDTRAEMLGVPVNNGCMARIAPGFMQKFFGALDRFEDLGGDKQKLVDDISMGVVHGLVGYFNMRSKKKVNIPKELQEKWGMSLSQ